MSNNNSETTTITTTKDSTQKGGIVWGGSLVGSQNPSNLGYQYSHNKRFKLITDKEDNNLPSNVVIQFQNKEGQDVGTLIDVSTNDTDVDALSSMVHSLLTEEKQQMYSFYSKVKRNGVWDSVEVKSTIANFIQEYDISTEEIIQLTYQPLTVYHVRPVTRCAETMPGHTEAVLHVSYSPNGKHLASGGGDTTVRFWDVNTNLPKYTCKKHKNHVLCTIWSTDGNKFASGDKNGILIVWDPKIGKDVSTIKAHSKYISSIAFEPFHRNKNCERLVTASKDGLCKIWNIRTKRCEVTLSGHLDCVECVKWGGEGLIYTASRDRTIKVWGAEGGSGDMTMGKLVKTLTGHGHRVNTLALSTDYVCRVGPYTHKCESYQSIQEAHDASITNYNQFQSSQISTVKERLVSGSDDFTLLLWHPRESKQAIKRMTGHQQIVNQIVFTPNGKYIASASFDKKVKLWNGYNGDFITTMTGHVGAVYQVAFSSDSHYLVSASKDSTLKLWQIPTGNKAKETLPGHEDEIYTLDWNPNGKSVASGSKDRKIKVWTH